MKNINKTAFIVSLLVLIAAFSVLSMTSMPEEFRYTWVGLNPWNGVEGLAFTVRYFLHTSVAVTYIITVALLFLIGGGFMLFFTGSGIEDLFGIFSFR